MRVAINGAGVAGPALAFWLRRSGHEVLLVEEAPAPRTGGYVIDFWGIGYDIADRMGLIPEIRRLGYQVKEVRFVGRRGHRSGGFKVAVFDRATGGRFTSLARSDLAGTIVRALDPGVEVIYGDSIAAIDDRGDTVRLAFDHAPPREVDLVIGADGLHSRVRHLVFGDDGEREVSLGYHVAAFQVEGYRPRDELVYVSHGTPGRQISRFTLRGDRTMFLFVFHDECLPTPAPVTEAERRTALCHIFADAGWEAPAVLDALMKADAVYFDRVSQIRMERWTKGRVALIGDAAACVSLLAGEGTGLAITEAYVLAGELLRANGDHTIAFARYEERLQPFLGRKQASAAKFASSFAPRTALGLAFRDAVTRLFGIGFLADRFVAADLRDDVELPDYGFESAMSASR
ncbi:MAG: FAD-binding domain [Gemmatimonadales bacterium]